jgi:HSP20 family protein
MATRTSGRGDERSSGRNANSASQSATSGGGQGRSQTQSAAPSQTASQSQSTNRTPNQSSNRSRDTQSQQAQGSSGAGESQSRGDQQRELRTAREQGNMRPAASTQRGNIGRESAGYGGSSAGAGANPFALMRRMMEDMDRLFSDFGFTTPGMFGSSLLGQDASRSGQRSLGASSSGRPTSAGAERGEQALQRSGSTGGLQRSAFGGLWAPQVEVFERGNNLVVRADLPGLSRENVDVELDDDALIIRGERRSDVEDDEEGFYRSERSYGSFYRAIPLPEGIDASACNATFRDGVLEVTLPKPPQQSSRTRRIDVRGG